MDATNKPKAFWDWARAQAKWTGTSGIGGITPLKDENGQLLYEIGDITRRWFKHFKTLFRDHTGNSKRSDHWTHIKAMPQHPMLLDLNAHIKRDEVWKALEGAKRHKAPGIDGIPMDLLKVAIEEMYEAENETKMGREGKTPMTDCITRLVNT